MTTPALNKAGIEALIERLREPIWELGERGRLVPVTDIWRDDMRAAADSLSALTASKEPGQEPVVVKPLEWRDGEARTAFGSAYSVHRNVNSTFTAIGCGAFVGGSHDTIEAAKAAAQADYESRIRSTLIPAKVASQAFPPTSCNAWEDCSHDGLCHDPQGCGGIGPNSQTPVDVAPQAAVVVRECPGADNPEERCPRPPHECTCWDFDLDYHPKHVRAALEASTGGAETDYQCPICAKPIEPADLCSSDIELGTCHAECLDGSPTVDLSTGEPVDGPIPTFRYDAPVGERKC